MYENEKEHNDDTVTVTCSHSSPEELEARGHAQRDEERADEKHELLLRADAEAVCGVGRAVTGFLHDREGDEFRERESVRSSMGDIAS